jgi:hypothetical protein
MKKSCFIKGVVIATILVAVIVYVVQYKLEDWLIKPGKKYIVSELVKKLDAELVPVNESSQKDSLRSLLIYYLKNVKSTEEVVNLEQEKFLKEFELFIKDSLISDDEISKLTLLLNKEKNEKSKSNRN